MGSIHKFHPADEEQGAEIQMILMIATNLPEEIVEGMK
jgi:hypothetical protein